MRNKSNNNNNGCKINLERVVRECIFEMADEYRGRGGRDGKVIGISESKKEAKNYLKVNLERGNIDSEEVKRLFEIDPSDSKKYVIWMTKRYIESGKSLSFDEMRSYIEEYDVFVKRNRDIKHKDINQYETFDEFKNDVDRVNQTGGNVSVSDLERDYDVIIDDDDLYIVSPHTHEASRKLGQSDFAWRNCGKDSAWCVTYKAPDHFNSYYYNSGLTFYYVKIKSPELLKKVIESIPNHGKALEVTAITVDERKKTDVYDAKDRTLNNSDKKIYLKLTGLS